jgi:hypothetical protein
MQSLEYYKSLAVGKARTVELNQEEECVVLKAHDYGVKNLNEGELQLLDRLVSKLKDEIWP